MIAAIGGPADIAAAARGFDLGRRPVLVLVGGAAHLGDEVRQLLAAIFAEVIGPAIARREAIAVTGGTDSGVMRLLGRARSSGPAFPLVGVTAQGTVGDSDGRAPLEPHHTHFVLVPGDAWGDESPYLPLVAAALADGRAVVTLVVNGGDITLDDAVRSVEAGIPVVALSGTGRAADQIAAAVAGHPSSGDPRLSVLAQSGHVRVVPVTNRKLLAGRLDDHLAG